MRMPVETMAIRVDGAEDTGFQPPFSGSIQQILHRQTAHVIQQPRLLPNTDHSVSGRVKTRRSQSPSGRRFSSVAVHRSVAFFPQDGQARLPHELVTYLTWGQSGLSQLYSFTSSIRVPQASILVTASPPISRKPPASRKDVQHWLAVNRRFSDRC